MRRLATLTAIAAACALLAAPALAQKLQKYQTPDGKIVYSDRPVPGARLVDEIVPPPPPDPKAVEAARAAARKEGERADKAVGQRLDKQAAAQSDAESAAAALEQAKKRLEAGREPLPGERLGTAGGQSRLTDEYFARQRANEAAVAEAQARLDKARGAK